ncbi:major facilitator superfamily transporter [Colletotrichum chrysophilum]|uniref:Major facilitator superfamily transporter n=1 Tax=Colletotrichum chrysophilum TaxID=1836956 RepID=A0AAD9ARK1_9PEZI|nr:major facilitator superfamily transporter [Colletotrichum chrysophilum]
MSRSGVDKDSGKDPQVEMLDDAVKPNSADDVVIQDRELKERRLVRRIDIRILVFQELLLQRTDISWAHVLNYLDRNNIATARLGDFEKDIGLVGTQYNTIISVFFVGYILTQVPTNMILNKMRPSIFLPVVMCCWAVVSASTGAVQNYTGAVVLRFLLGFVEAPFFPGALYLFSSWYTKKELAVRISVLYAAGQMAGAFGGLLGSAIMGGMNGKLGLADWRWLFIIEGTIPIPVAVLTYFTLPDYPTTTKWLTDEERQLATLRITEEAVEEDDRGEATAWQGLKMSFTDPALYMIWLMQLGLNTAASFTNFFPTIVATLGYNQRNTLLLSAPPYVFAAILGITNSWHSDKHRERWLHIVWPQVFCSVGFIISATTHNVAARYTATFMMMSVYGSFGCILSWVSTTLPRPSTKRAVSYAVVNAGSNLASIYASYFYPKSHGPQYWQANILNVAFAALCILLATILHFYLRWRNRKLRRAGDEDLLAAGVREGSRSRALGERWQCHPAYQYTL